MGILSVFKWFRRDGQGNRHRWNMSPELIRLNNETCRIKAIRAFMERRRNESDSRLLLISSPDEEVQFKTYVRRNNANNKPKDNNDAIPGVPHIASSELFEIGWVAGTEDRYLEYIYSEWDNTKVSIKKHSHPECVNAIKADLKVLTEIRHPNIVLLVATSYMRDHGLVSIFESLNCTLYHYIHEKDVRISVQEATRCARKLTEALGFAHMRGFIHGAISSHCVFLASGVIKLGGWELAVQKDQTRSDSSTRIENSKPKRDFEDRLRAEIFRWQAPEIFCGHTPSEATDVYGLSLLIWEMTTRNLPWGGLSKSEVERQYNQWEQGVMIDFYNFPQLLTNLLEAGLQIDVTKRTMNMNRMRRFLQRLELQYESKASIYADQHTNNNNINQPSKTFNVPVSISSTSKSPTTPLSSENYKPVPKTLFNSEKKVCNRVTRSCYKKKSPKTKNDNKVDMNIADNKNTNLLLKGQRLYNEVRDSLNEGRQDIWITFDSPELGKEATEDMSSVENIAAKEINFTTEEPVSSNCSPESSMTLESFSSSDNSGDLSETLNDLKKLRKTMASRRERFFYGNGSSESINTKCSADTSGDTEDKNDIFNSVRSKDYKPHKPASHQTSLEPKLNKNFQYNTMLIKSANHQQEKTTPSAFTSEIKEAVLHPQLYNANCQDFFESSLWKKEKMICISKMSKNESQDVESVPQMTSKNSLSYPENMKPIEKYKTFTLKDRRIQEEEKNNIVSSEGISQDTEDSGGKSLVALKEALDRATDIIRPSPPVSEGSRESSPLRTLDEDIKINPSDMETGEALFENLLSSQIGRVDPDSEIRSIERSTNEEELDQFDQNTYKVNKKAVINWNLNESNSQCHAGNQISDLEDKDNDQNMTLMLFSDKNPDKGCNSCHHMTALARRRSLPAALGQLKAYSKMSIGKLPIRKGDLPDSTVEDIYIDDEFGDTLNVNMVLLHEEIDLDEDTLPDLLELSHNSLYGDDNNFLAT